MEIEHWQMKVCLLCQKLLFQRWIQEITQDLQLDLKFQSLVLKALQEASENYLISLLENMNLCTILTKWVMIMPNDMQLPVCLHNECASHCY